MHYYQHHIGDFIRDTANLTDSQCMSYLRLIWSYYDTEGPIEDSPKKLAFKLGSDVETIELLLEAFFQKGADGWHHKRIDAEISEYHSKAKKARESANARWANSKRNADAMPTQCQGNADAMRTNGFSSKVDANQEPITNNQDISPPNPPNGAKSRKGEKLPIGFEFPSEWITSAMTEMRCTRSAVESDCFAFLTYYTNGKGKNESHIDWRMTWRNWYRKSYSECSKSVSENRNEKRQPVDNSAPAKVARAIAERDAQRFGGGIPPDDFIELGSSDYQAVPY